MPSSQKTPLLGLNQWGPDDKPKWPELTEDNARVEQAIFDKVGPMVNILGTYPTIADLRLAVPTPKQGDMYNIGTTFPYRVHMWDTTVTPADWLDQGELRGPIGETGPVGEKGSSGVFFGPVGEAPAEYDVVIDPNGSAFTTDNVPEGEVNQYYTNERVDQRIAESTAFAPASHLHGDIENNGKIKKVNAQEYGFGVLVTNDLGEIKCKDTALDILRGGTGATDSAGALAALNLKHYIQSNLSAPGWYRVGTLTRRSTTLSIMCDLAIGGAYIHDASEAVMCDICGGYSTSTITLRCKNATTLNNVTKVRIVKNGNEQLFVDIYYARSSLNAVTTFLLIRDGTFASSDLSLIADTVTPLFELTL